MSKKNEKSKRKANENKKEYIYIYSVIYEAKPKACGPLGRLLAALAFPPPIPPTHTIRSPANAKEFSIKSFKERI